MVSAPAVKAAVLVEVDSTQGALLAANDQTKIAEMTATFTSALATSLSVSESQIKDVVLTVYRTPSVSQANKRRFKVQTVTSQYQVYVNFTLVATITVNTPNAPTITDIEAELRKQVSNTTSPLCVALAQNNINVDTTAPLLLQQAVVLVSQPVSQIPGDALSDNADNINTWLMIGAGITGGVIAIVLGITLCWWCTRKGGASEQYMAMHVKRT
jgi:hypothetical protein